MAISVKDFRFSLIWVATCLDPVANASPAFANRTGYEALFNAARKKCGKGFGLPWPLQKPYVHRFWCNYLQVADPAQIDGNRAWNKAVPLRRMASLFKATSAGFPGWIGAEHYFYPFGIAFILTFNGSDSLTGDDWVEAICATAVNKLSVSFGSAPPADYPLAGLAGETLKQMREKFFGAAVGAPVEPFTIATVIRGEGADENTEPEEDGELHRWLFGAATRQGNWKTAKLDDVSLADDSLTIRKAASPGDIVFATARGRAIWIPSAFTHPGAVGSDGKPLTSLSCYHRNQLFAALQVESLCSLAKALTNLLAASPNLPQQLDEFGRIAASTLADLDGGSKDKTYRSISVHRQIADRGSLADIAVLRTRYGV